MARGPANPGPAEHAVIAVVITCDLREFLPHVTQKENMITLHLIYFSSPSCIWSSMKVGINTGLHINRPTHHTGSGRCRLTTQIYRPRPCHFIVQGIQDS